RRRRPPVSADTMAVRRSLVEREGSPALRGPSPRRPGPALPRVHSENAAAADRRSPRQLRAGLVSAPVRGPANRRAPRLGGRFPVAALASGGRAFRLRRAVEFEPWE